MDIEQIKLLVKSTPNDQELGRELRKLMQQEKDLKSDVHNVTLYGV